MEAFQTYAFNDILRIGVALIFLAAGLIAVLYSIWGGFLLITSGGKEEKVKPAINHIRHAVLGLIVLMVVLFVAPTLTSFIGLPITDDIKPSRIFQTIQELSSNFFGSNASSSTFDSNSSTPSSQSVDFTDL